MSQTVKVHVTYEETKRVISQQKGGEVQALRHLFLQVFSDVLSDRVAPANVTFQRYDDNFADYVELENDEKIKDDVKILALISKPDKQISLSKHDKQVTKQNEEVSKMKNRYLNRINRYENKVQSPVNCDRLVTEVKHGGIFLRKKINLKTLNNTFICTQMTEII